MSVGPVIIGSLFGTAMINITKHIARAVLRRRREKLAARLRFIAALQHYAQFRADQEDHTQQLGPFR